MKDWLAHTFAGALTFRRQQDAPSAVWANSQGLLAASKILALLFALFSSLLPMFGEVLTGPVTNTATGHIYYLLAPNTWSSSEEEAVTLGGHLVTIDDAIENDWVFSTFSAFGGQPRCLWIGYRRQQIHGDFTWSAGASSTFTNWSVNEPNDYFYGGEPEFYAFMWDPSRTEFFRLPGTWNDVPDITAMDGIVICGVVEVTRPRLVIEKRVGSTRIGWTSHTNKTYQAEYRASLATTNVWLPLRSPTAGNGLTNYVLDAIPEAAARFYRVREL
jgi:hypothetical protein